MSKQKLLALVIKAIKAVEALQDAIEFDDLSFDCNTNQIIEDLEQLEADIEESEDL